VNESIPVLEGVTTLIANPSADVYGSDLQMLETISALVGAGGRVVVTLPAGGPLVPQVRERGAEVAFVEYPVLRRANQSVAAFAQMALSAVAAVPRLVHHLRRTRPSVVYVNTVTLPWWLLAARLTRTPVVCHVHEAETADSRLVKLALVWPLRLADAVIVISRAAMSAMVEVVPTLAGRAHLVFNGVPQPTEEPVPPARREPFRLVVVGRLSPRKAPHLALEAAAQLRTAGYPVEIELAGTAFPGYEWYVDELRARSDEPDLAGKVTFAGYCNPIWGNLQAADIVLAPSLREPFGNAVVEAQLSLRPVVATGALGHLESITDGQTGLLVEAGDVEGMTAAVARLIDDPSLADRLAVSARQSAVDRFSTDRYRREVVEIVAALSSGHPVRSVR